MKRRLTTSSSGRVFPARILILRKCQRAAQYPSDLEARVSAKYGALYHHMNSLVETNLLLQNIGEIPE